VRIELPEGTEWTRPFQFCLQMPERRMLARWRVFPPHPAPGQVFDAPRGGGSATVASPLSEEIELDPVGPGEPPLWEVEPPPVSGEGSPGDVAMGADGAAFGIANVPVGDWKVFLRRLERERAPDRTKGNRPGRLERELWEAPSFRPSPEKVKVRAGETASVVLLGR
jgi:hypothetical protein